MSNVWMNQANIRNSEKTLSVLESKLKDQYQQIFFSQIWNDNVKTGNGNKLRFYRLFKQNYDSEKYLAVVKNFKLRRAFTRLRLSNHKPRVELGRYRKEPYDKRICLFCQHQVVENEQHFIKSCELCNDIRNIC